ncbi:MAG: nuclear transport factor 2 family protein [Clostridia bacterium]|nr:nuclear transport factor 2 family protein [Clostridia bacterium]
MKTDEEAIRGLYRDYWRYMIEKDAGGLRRIMADDYYLLHMTGVRQSKEEFIKGLLGGTFNYFSADHDGIDVEISENSAKMTGRSLVSAAVYGGGKHTWRLQGDFTLRKEKGRWKLTSSKASTY